MTSLVTFTYNDHGLVQGLLDHVPDWSAQPGEIVVVDDGSSTAFATSTPGVRVLRLASNNGITRAKHAGLCAASGRFLASMDADVRVSDNWLALCLEHAARPEVGLAACEVVHDAGSGLTARYLRAFGDNHNVGVGGEVDFVPGNAFVMRRGVWEECGGYAGHGDSVCEDHYLSARLRSLGYVLYSDCRARARQTRRIGRLTLCRRVWRWCNAAILGRMPRHPRLVPYLFEILVRPMLDRVEEIVRLGEPLFLYVEILYLAFASLQCVDAAVAQGLAPAGLGEELRRALAGLTRGLPRLRAVLRADLAGLGLRVDAVGPGPSEAFDDYLIFGPMLRSSRALAWLDVEGAALLLAEDREYTHFSNYDAVPGSGTAV